jgi:hypothetical protein
MSEHLTNDLVRRLAAPATGNRVVFDTKVKGFGVQITAAGSRSFVLKDRTKAGRQRQVTIGAFPAWSTTAARDAAAALKRRFDSGEDVLAAEREDRQSPTMGDLCDKYLSWAETHKRPSSVAGDRMAVRLYIRPQLGARKVVEVRREDIERLHRKISAGDGKRKASPIRANRIVALLSTMFALSRTWYVKTLPSGEEVSLRVE